MPVASTVMHSVSTYGCVIVRDARPSAETVELLARRYEFLIALETRAYEKRELVDELSVSRSTVDRGLRELEAAALVDEECDGYHLTLYGQTLLAVYDSMLTSIERTRRAKSLLAALPSDVDFEFGLLVGAEIHLADPPDARAPTARLAELIEEASRLRALAYAYTSPEAVELFHRRICEEELDAELVFREAMYDRLRERHPARTIAVTGHDRCRTYTIEDAPFGLFVVDSGGTERACLVVYDRTRSLQGLVVNDSPEAVEWASRLVDRYRSRATPVNPD